VTSRLVFRFRDGSLHDETVVFSQSGSFRLIRDHLVQKGPAFERAVDLSIDAGSGQVTVRYADKDGKEKTASQRLDLPADLANGLIFTLLKNIRPETPRTTFSMVAATPKPRLVKLIVTPAGQEPFAIGGSPRKAVKYVVRVEIGGLAGFAASLLGKKPPDSHVWILGGEAPAFVKSEGPLSMGGPLWRIELASPAWEVSGVSPETMYYLPPWLDPRGWSSPARSTTLWFGATSGDRSSVTTWTARST
jgi:hypothetical protein